MIIRTEKLYVELVRYAYVVEEIKTIKHRCTGHCCNYYLYTFRNVTFGGLKDRFKDIDYEVVDKTKELEKLY